MDKKFKKDNSSYDDKNPSKFRKESKKVCVFCAEKNEVIDYKNAAKLKKYMTEKGKIIPLVLYGSYWYEPQAGGCRFCGDNEIKPDLSSDIMKYIPHYFVLGIKIK